MRHPGSNLLKYSILCTDNQKLQVVKSRDSSVGIALVYGVLGFDFWRELGIFLFTTAYITTLGPTQPPIQWVPEALSLSVKWLGREANHSPPSSVEVKE
jgi:hypothetical protein